MRPLSLVADPTDTTTVQAMAPPLSLLDRGDLPVAALAELAGLEAESPRPIYGAHRWFARRFGTAMRGLLIAATTTSDDEFWDVFYGRAPSPYAHGKRSVLDPFLGGGTIAVEAQRLGARVHGVEIDPVAHAITTFELGAAHAGDVQAALEHLSTTVGHQLADLYRTSSEGEERTALHFHWTQVVNCGRCQREFPVRRNAVLGIEGDHHWLSCVGCGAVDRKPRRLATHRCATCQTRNRVDVGTLDRGRARCPDCRHEESLIDMARRTGERPRFSLTVVESIPVDGRRRIPIAERTFHQATSDDIERYTLAKQRLACVEGLPNAPIEGSQRYDHRPLHYQYEDFRQMFNARQQLHLVMLARAIADLDSAVRLPVALAYSNHVVSSSMLTGYSVRWRQATPVFAIRAFRHTPNPAELNPWLYGVGRGTFPNAVRKVVKAVSYARRPTELSPRGLVEVPSAVGPAPDIVHGDARQLPHLATDSVDLVLTDPPYFDNIAYSELAALFHPFLKATGLIGRDAVVPVDANLASSDRTAAGADRFQAGLAACFAEARRVLTDDGRLVFTYQHSDHKAWHALASALGAASFRVLSVFPIKGDVDRSLHRRSGSSTWDAVFVAAPTTTAEGPSTPTDEHRARLNAWCEQWVAQLDLGPADATVLQRAVEAAGSVGFLADNSDHVSQVEP